MKKIFSILVILVLLVMGCSSIDGSRVELTLKEFELSANCFESDRNHGKFGVLIQNEEEYSTKLRDICKTKQIPSVDFSKNTIIGIISSGSGCSREFIKNAYRDDNQRKVVYSVDVKEKGGCKPLFQNWDLVLIPKIPEGYTVELR